MMTSQSLPQEKYLSQAVRELIDHEHTSEFNQALMELGALYVRPENRHV